MEFQFTPSLYAPTLEQALLTRLRWDSWRAGAEDPLFGFCPVMERFAEAIDQQTDRSSTFRPKGAAGRRFRRRFLDALTRMPHTWAPEREHDRARRIVELAAETLAYDEPWQVTGRYIQRNGWGGERGRVRAAEHDLIAYFRDHLDWGFLILAYQPALEIALGRDPRRTLSLFEQLIDEHHEQGPSAWFTLERAEGDRLSFVGDLWNDLLDPDAVHAAAARHPHGSPVDAVLELAETVSPRATTLERRQWRRYLTERERWQQGLRNEPQPTRFGLVPSVRLAEIEAQLVAARAGKPLPPATPTHFESVPERPATAPLIEAARGLPRLRLTSGERHSLRMIREGLANYARFEGFPYHRPRSAAQWLDELITREQALLERPRTRDYFEPRVRRVLPLLRDLQELLPANATGAQLIVMLDACTSETVRVESERWLRKRKTAAVFPRLVSV